MSTNDTLTIPQSELVQGWRTKLPECLDTGFSAKVEPDEANPHALNIEIRTNDHEMLELTFRVQYMDSREIEIELLDVQQEDRSVDERNDSIQQSIANCRRQMHECAQILQAITHA
ncbi:hypothetical protein [Paenibacillus sp. GCM10027626]|uniref:hypothetical protein n=1 Tax=Paenibacillus sp. GCM10027626 TaxID=3273411 RepID=UPI00363E77A6